MSWCSAPFLWWWRVLSCSVFFSLRYAHKGLFSLKFFLYIIFMCLKWKCFCKCFWKHLWRESVMHPLQLTKMKPFFEHKYYFIFLKVFSLMNFQIFSFIFIINLKVDYRVKWKKKQCVAIHKCSFLVFLFWIWTLYDIEKKKGKWSSDSSSSMLW